MIVTTKKLFEAAYGKYAIGAYNINNLEQAMGLFRGNLESKAPFIIQISKGARAYTHKKMLEAMIRAADEIFPEAIFAVHLSMATSGPATTASRAVSTPSVMIDASHEPFEKNVEITRRCGGSRPCARIVVEAELGRAGRRGRTRQRGRSQRAPDRPRPEPNCSWN